MLLIWYSALNSSNLRTLRSNHSFIAFPTLVLRKRSKVIIDLLLIIQHSFPENLFSIRSWSSLLLLMRLLLLNDTTTTIFQNWFKWHGWFRRKQFLICDLNVYRLFIMITFNYCIVFIFLFMRLIWIFIIIACLISLFFCNHFDVLLQILVFEVLNFLSIWLLAHQIVVVLAASLLAMSFIYEICHYFIEFSFHLTNFLILVFFFIIFLVIVFFFLILILIILRLLLELLLVINVTKGHLINLVFSLFTIFLFIIFLIVKLLILLLLLHQLHVLLLLHQLVLKLFSVVILISLQLIRILLLLFFFLMLLLILFLLLIFLLLFLLLIFLVFFVLIKVLLLMCISLLLLICEVIPTEVAVVLILIASTHFQNVICRVIVFMVVMTLRIIFIRHLIVFAKGGIV